MAALTPDPDSILLLAWNAAILTLMQACALLYLVILFSSNDKQDTNPGEEAERELTGKADQRKPKSASAAFVGIIPLGGIPAYMAVGWLLIILGGRWWPFGAGLALASGGSTAMWFLGIVWRDSESLVKKRIDKLFTHLRDSPGNNRDEREAGAVEPTTDPPHRNRREAR